MSNQVEVEVVLSGAEQAQKGLSGIGETAGKMAERFDSENSKLGEGLSSLTDNVGELVGSMGELGAATKSMGSMSTASLMGLVPAVGAVVAAGFALYETFMNISGAAQEAENRTEAMAAAAGDLQSKLEALSEKGVLPTTEQLKEFTRATIDAQVAKELLQLRFEKLTKSYGKILDAQEEVTKAERVYTSGNILDVLSQSIGLTDGLAEARQSLAEAQSKYNTEVGKLLPMQDEVNKKISTAAKLNTDLEDSSAEATLSRVKENIALLESLQLRQAEIDLTEQGLKLQQIEITATKETALLQAEVNKEDAKALALLEDKLKAKLAEFNQEKQIEALRIKRRQAAQASEKQSAKSSIKRIDDQRIKEMALERQKQADLRVLRQLELQQMALDGASALQIANERYKDELTAAEGNHEKGLIAAKRYEIALTQINQQEATKREQAETQRRQREEEMRKQASALAYSSLEFDLQMMSEGLDKEIALLTLRYERERNLNAATQNEITELNRREAIERERIIEASTQAQIEQIGQFASSYGAGLAEAAYSSLLFGESFTKATGQILIALGRQAAIQSLMELAEGTAALFKPFGQAEAAGHFKAAAIFAGVSAAAGVTGKSMGGGGGAAGGGGGGATPSGAPTQAPAPQREQAEQAPMVFNINFGGAVIYDTQRAAEQAMADRITTLQNTRRRGAPRR
jgi:hypothetical protein